MKWDALGHSDENIVFRAKIESEAPESCTKTKTSTSESQQVVVLVMSSFKDMRDFLFVGYAHDMFDDEEFCLVYDFYQ